MKKDEPSEMEETVDLGGHGHIGSEKKAKKMADEMRRSHDEDLSGGDDVRLARRNTAPHIGAAASGLFLSGRNTNMSPSSGDGPSIFDSIGEEEGLESFLLSASSSRVSRDLSMSPFSRIRNDLENFVEESDRDIEARLLVPQSPLLRNGFGSSGGLTSIPHSPLISSTTAREDLPCAESSTVWVGNLDGETTEEALMKAFGPFGPIQSVKILDNYAFIRYEDANSAAMALAEMNGHTLGRTVIRTGVGRDDSPAGLNRKASFEFTSLMGGAAKSVWVGNLPLETDERTLAKIFSPYGVIENIRLVPTKRCAFVIYSRAEQASAAIAELDGHLKIGDELVRLGYARHAVSQPAAPMAPSSSLAVPKTTVRRSSTGSINYSSASGAVGLPNTSRMDIMNLPGDASEKGNMESLRNIFGAMDMDGNGKRTGVAGFQSAILTPAPKPPTITVTSPSAKTTARPEEDFPADEVEEQDLDYNWEIPELPLPYFGPDLTPGRIRDYRRHIESLNCKPSEFDLIAMEIIPVAVSASTDPVGNVLVQKLIERGSDDLKSMIISELEPYMAAIGIHKNGTWVVQKLINWCTLPEHQMSVAESLKPYLVPLFQDQFGNYVIQCCLQFEHGRNQFIMDGLARQSLRIANSRFGSRAMRSCLESPHTTPKQQKQVAASVLENAGKLLVDPNGVIVMQWLLDSDLPGKYKIMQPVLETALPSLLGLRFASNLVAKLLTQSAEPDVRESLLNLLIINPEQGSSPIQTLLKEPSCVQVVSKILMTVPSSQRAPFVEALRKALGTMIQQGGSNPQNHLVKLAAEIKDSKKTAQGTFDLSHLISISSDTSSGISATPSPQPVIITSKLRAHVDSQTSSQEHPHFVFGTQQLDQGKDGAGPSSQHRSGSVTQQNQKF